MRPDYADAYYGYGVVFGALNAPDLALEAYAKALSLDPTIYQAHNNTGFIYAGQGKLELALREFDAALAIYVYPAALGNKARALALLERWSECIDAVEQLVKLDEQATDTLRRDSAYDKLRKEPTFGPRFQRLVGG